MAAIVAARATDMGLFDNWLSDMVKAALDKVAAGADPRDLSVVHRRRVTVHPTGDPNMVVFLAAPEGEVTTDAMVVEMAARSAELDAEDATRATGTATVVSLPRQGARKRHQADAVDSPPRESTMES